MDLYDMETLVPANLDWISLQVATGGDLHVDEDLARRQIADAVAQGVTHVMDCRVEYSDAPLWAKYAPQVRFLHNPVDDAHGYQVPKKFFDRGLLWAGLALRQGGKVFVHCHMGVNRGPSMAMAVLADNGYTLAEAFVAVRNARDIAFVGYAEQVALYFGHRQGVTLEDAEAFEDALRPARTQDEARRINRIIQGLHHRDDEDRDILHMKRQAPKVSDYFNRIEER